MKQPLVSIIVPTYNVEKYVEECIDSLLNQTYKNIEIIVLDDASTDETVSLLNQYKDKIKLIENKENKGQGTRRNQGIHLAKGEYLYFLDSDDWIESDTIEQLIDQALKTDADLVRFNGAPFYEEISEPFRNKGNYDFSHQLEHQQTYTGERLLEKNRKSFSASPCLYLTKKEVIDTYNLYFLEGVLHEDEYFTTRLFCSVKKMTYLNQAFYHRRYRIGSTMTKNADEHKIKSFESYIKVFKALEKEYRNPSLSKKQKKFVKRQLLSIYNGLKESTVHNTYKKKTKELKSITLKDKVFLAMAKSKQNLKKNN